ncbi:GAF domain-containing protein [Rhodopseudomonas boonkerdii]|nr:GAF domain-containing protein [Rhodopseudomonas boonkerdii]
MLDTGPEPEFDDIVMLARQICDAPVALISLVDAERQWFKAVSGLEICETSIEQSVCAHALAMPETLNIPDLTRDPRTKDNPHVTGEPYLRFYAGAPLIAAEGVAIGTVCVIDTVPRPGGLLSDQLIALEALARQVMTQLELRRDLVRAYAQARHHDPAPPAVGDRTDAAINAELGQRMNNAMALVQAIANQTLRNVTERYAVDAFERRLDALSRAHNILQQQGWISAGLREVLAGVLAAHADKSRVRLDGPDIRLDPKAALSFSMLLHELATNAVKYGALGNNRGHVAVSWATEGGTLVLDWRETGGPEVTTPSRKGLGTRLIDLGIAGAGNVSKSYDASGFRAMFRVPMEKVAQGS